MLVRATVAARCLLACGVLAAACALAQDYPSKPIRLIVPFPPGGATDLTGRLVAQHLSEELRQQIVVDNRAGAGGMVGTEAAARSAPDGYTLLYGSTSTLAMAPGLYPNVRYDPRTSFAPVSLVASSPMLVTANAKGPATLRQLIESAKRLPGKYNYASAGSGTPPHLGAELFKNLAGADLVHVPYKGGGPALQAVLGGEVQMYVEALIVVLPHVRAGKLNALAITSATRDPSLPDVPTVAEAGLPAFQFGLWNGVVAPAGTPAAIVARLNAALRKTLAGAPMHEALTRQGLRPAGNTPEQFAAFIASEMSRWEKVIREAGVKVDN